ncbi:MAG TPA: RagB/SusD family nutrient uptake outer membrane protein [Porphyromonadaceae bacterium]|nr:RagB/SusD family nutrient uptake outer membrane protein [Porphyromonadaceae bacterium]
MKYLKYLITAILFVGFALTSCEDYLDVSDELAEERSLEKIFSNPQDVRKWHRNIYKGIPNTMNFYWISVVWDIGMGNPWPNLADELIPSFEENYPYTRALSPADRPLFYGRWHLYQLIRQANVFLENAKEIPKTGDADYIGLPEVEELKAQARFLRAYYHYLLFELYGPVPIMEKSANPADPDLDFARNSVDEVVDFIYTELTDILEDLKGPNYYDPNYLAVPTKGTALAVRARLMVYAASPLFNGGYTEALQLTNKDGKRLFPDKDDTKWQKALNACQAFIDYANAGHYELHKEYTNGVYDPYKSVYEVHMKFNKEIILARSDDQGVINAGGPVGNIDFYTIPRGARGGGSSTGGGGVLQELVDDYFMCDGLAIEESPLYTETGFSTAGEDLTGRTEIGTHRMYINREPRFYQNIFYNGRKWHIGGEQIWYNKGGNSDNSGFAPRSGASLYKRLSQRVYHLSPHPLTEYRPIMIFRLPEFYLLYAEALNEVSPGDPRILEYVDKVRERAGIPLLAAIKPQIKGNQEAQRKAIRAEMRIELATEGQRYFDVKRWMIAENKPGEGGLGGDFTGMDMEAKTLTGFYKRIVIQKRVFERKEYLAPLPQEEIQKSRLLVQNPGYTPTVE